MNHPIEIIICASLGKKKKGYTEIVFNKSRNFNSSLTFCEQRKLRKCKGNMQGNYKILHKGIIKYSTRHARLLVLFTQNRFINKNITSYLNLQKFHISYSYVIKLLS